MFPIDTIGKITYTPTFKKDSFIPVANPQNGCPDAFRWTLNGNIVAEILRFLWDCFQRESLAGAIETLDRKYFKKEVNH